MRSHFRILILLCLAILSCRKDDQDPFFNSFPKEFIFETVENASPARLFTNNKEIFDTETINKFTDNVIYFKGKQVFEDYYKNDTFIFVSNSAIKYSGINEWKYRDTLFYTKSENSLHIKSKEYRRIGNAFLCNLPVCHLFKWSTDSIDYKDYGMAGPEFSTLVFNTRYEVIGDELHIPITAYRYQTLHYGESSASDNEFNEDVIHELTSDSLAIIEYKLIFKKQSD